MTGPAPRVGVSIPPPGFDAHTEAANYLAAAADAGELPANSVAVVSLHLAGPNENAVGFEASIVNTGT